MDYQGSTQDSPTLKLSQVPKPTGTWGYSLSPAGVYMPIAIEPIGPCLGPVIPKLRVPCGNGSALAGSYYLFPAPPGLGTSTCPYVTQTEALTLPCVPPTPSLYQDQHTSCFHPSLVWDGVLCPRPHTLSTLIIMTPNSAIPLDLCTKRHKSISPGQLQ